MIKKRAEQLRAERKARLENYRPPTPQEELKRIQAIFYGKRKDLNRSDVAWLIKMVQQAITEVEVDV